MIRKCIVQVGLADVLRMSFFRRCCTAAKIYKKSFNDESRNLGDILKFLLRCLAFVNPFCNAVSIVSLIFMVLLFSVGIPNIS